MTTATPIPPTPILPTPIGLTPICTPTPTPAPLAACTISINNGQTATNQRTVTIFANAPDAAQVLLSNDGILPMHSGNVMWQQRVGH